MEAQAELCTNIREVHSFAATGGRSQAWKSSLIISICLFETSGHNPEYEITQGEPSISAIKTFSLHNHLLDEQSNNDADNGYY